MKATVLFLRSRAFHQPTTLSLLHFLWSIFLKISSQRLKNESKTQRMHERRFTDCEKLTQMSKIPPETNASHLSRSVVYSFGACWNKGGKWATVQTWDAKHIPPLTLMRNFRSLRFWGGCLQWSEKHTCARTSRKIYTQERHGNVIVD